MMKYTAAIIDDEVDAIGVIEILLKKYFKNITVVLTASTVTDAIEGIEKFQPDIVFLDIELTDGSGFEVAAKTKELNYRLIFTTAYTQYAIEAFKVKALDYILKPVEEKDFQQAIQRAIEGIEQDPLHPPKKILFSTHEGNFYFMPDDIVYLQSDSNYTKVFMKERKHFLLSKTLKEMEQNLPSTIFIRVHNSYLVNQHYITGYQKGDGGILFLNKTIQIPVSRSKKDALHNFLNGI